MKQLTFKLFYICLIGYTIISCREDESPIKNCIMITSISDALPIHLFLNDEETFNESDLVSQNMEKFCFNQEFQCDDEIRFQLYDDNQIEKDYKLQFYDYEESGSLIGEIEFAKSPIFTTEAEFQLENNSFDSSLTNWSIDKTAGGSNATWNWNSGSAQSSNGASSQSARLYQGRINTGLDGYAKWPPGTYTFKVIVNNNSVDGIEPLQEGFSLEAFDALNGFNDISNTVVLPRDATDYEYELTIELTAERNYFGFSSSKQGPSSGSKINVRVRSIEMLSNPLDYTGSVYDLMFVPTDEDICDKKIHFKVVDEDGEEQARSENFVEFSSSIRSSVLIGYKRNISFAGLIYDEESPYFYLRIPAKFFHPGKSGSTALSEQSNGQLITRNWMKKAKRKLEVGDGPEYHNNKIDLVVAHCVGDEDSGASLLINEVNWQLADGDQYEYEGAADRPGSYPLQPGEVWLSRANYFKQVSA